MNLIEHVERYLGPIEAGARLREGVQGAWFRERPFAGSSSFMTLGLSHHVFKQAAGNGIRLELLIACRNEFVESFNPLSILADVSDRVASTHVAPARGTVIGPAGRFSPQFQMEALYCCSPVYFDDGFAEYGGFSEPLVIIWLVPITPEEALYVQESGWDAFEDLLESAEPDLLDLERPSLVESDA
jgi:hypothetical protein